MNDEDLLIGIVVSVISIGIIYYFYVMLPYWYRQGYKSVNNKPETFKKLTTSSKKSNHNFNENKAKGDAFEDYVISLFNKEYFSLLDWRSDKMASNGMYALSNHMPDLVMMYNNYAGTKFKFAIECKWRASFINGQLEWAKDYQINNYLDYKNKNTMPVYVAIGVGGMPSKPERLFVTEIDNLKMYPHLYEKYLDKFEKKNHSIFFDNNSKSMV